MSDWTREDTAREIEQGGVRGTYNRLEITDERLAAIDKQVLMIGERHLSAESAKKRPKIDVRLLREVRETSVNVRKLRGDYPAEKREIDLGIRSLTNDQIEAEILNIVHQSVHPKTGAISNSAQSNEPQNTISGEYEITDNTGTLCESKESEDK